MRDQIELGFAFGGDFDRFCFDKHVVSMERLSSNDKDCCTSFEFVCLGITSDRYMTRQLAGSKWLTLDQ